MKLSLLISFLVMCGCASTQKAENSLPLDRVEKLKVGHDKPTDVLKLLGEPDFKVIVNGDRRFESWSYLKKKFGHQPRLNLDFDVETHVLRSFGWFVDPSEPEINLQKAQARYPYAKFETYRVDNYNPHSASELFVDDDSHLGLEIIWSTTLKEVEMISWSVPNSRTISSNKTHKAATVEKVLYDPRHLMD